MNLLETFHHELAAKLGDGTFELTGETYLGRYQRGTVEVPLIDIQIADDVGGMPYLVSWAANAAVKP